LEDFVNQQKWLSSSDESSEIESELSANIFHLVKVTKLSSTIGLAEMLKKYKLAPYGTDGRIFTNDVSANFKVM